MNINSLAATALSVISLFVQPAPCQPPAPATPPGLSSSNGVPVLNGTPYCGMGVNYFSLFSRALKSPPDRSYETGLRQLSEAGIPFARFMACGFWPSDWSLYQSDKSAYFARLDDIVRCAETNRVGLIPSLFWNMATVPDLVGEPVDQLGNPDSKTVAFIRQYTREVVTRYRDSRAVWAWEFGNEYALAADLPNADKHRPPVVPALKTALTRTARDELSSHAMLTAFAAFAEIARSLDPHRLLVTGNALPRPSAFHNTLEKSWKPDSPAQFESVLLRDNPDPFDTLCVHAYPKEKANEVYPGGAANLTALVAALQSLSLKNRKPLFIGEFGAPATSSPEQERARFEELVSAIETHAVPLSALWVFDLPQQDKDWNVTFANRRAYMLRRVSEVNRALRP
jgi:hypothetical protein